MISAYASAIQHKRKRDEVNEDASQEMAQQEERKRQRLEVFDPMLEAFNVGDFKALSKQVRSACHPEVRLKVSGLQREVRGVVPILLFYGLLHETFPDAMTKILEKRLSSSASAAAQRSAAQNSVEYVYKMVGTRITSRPVEESFAALLCALCDAASLSNEDEVDKAVARQMASIPPQAYEESECSYIVETVLALDGENRIVEWNHDILAADVR